MGAWHNQPGLLTDESPEIVIPDASERLWWVAHTKSRNEKALARDLSRLDIINYLPLRERTTRSARTGRSTVSVVPVFTGYLFFQATEPQRYQALATNRIANLLGVVYQQQLVDQLRQIHRVLATKTDFEHCPGLRVGRWARVTAGALAGLEGCIVKRAGKTRLCLGVDILGQSVLVEVPVSLLEPIDPPEEVLTRVSGSYCDC